MRTRGALALAMLWCGCAPLAMSRKAELREKTLDLRTTMRGDDVRRVLGEPSSRDGLQCPVPFSDRTCQRWVYDPAAGLPAFPQGRLFVWFLVSEDGALDVLSWSWDYLE